MTDDLLAQIEALERRLDRRLNVVLSPINDTLHRIETQTVLTNGRVTQIEQWRIASEARTAERALAVKEAANLVAKQAQQALQARERSKTWWATVTSLAIAAIGVVTTLSAFVASYFH